ncbi:Membrane protein insertase YidC [BD1-7 clade bacterium]|uniref:Membrane protein insertase YidC n=1 Tax=BD1-7 clade bacterium TaxID=2029982 RepID=A0A5S9N0U5_9GAMM|nr:Membrane protein insertase YidC [BD1-7 clade bacterium]CAA0083220.1 Membrane protein insertase YidC [BD1-7 clade bacterium]
MDKVRLVLLAAFAMVSLMLVVEYGQFRDAKSKEALMQRQQATPVAGASPAQGTDEAIPTQSSLPTITGGTDDVPTLSGSELSIDEPRVPSNRLIEVTTDNFAIKINPKGGDLVYLALRKESARLDTPDIPYVLLEETQENTYIASSGLIGANGTDTAKGRPTFHSAQSKYRLEDGKDTLQVDLTLQQGDVSLIKRFTFTRDDYLIDIDYLINNRSSSPWKAAFYAQIKRDSKPMPEAGGAGMGMQPYLGFATRTQEDRFQKVDFEDIEEKAFKTQIEGGWVAMIQHYFLSAWIPDANTENSVSIFRAKSGFNYARTTTPVMVVKANDEGKIHSEFYAGPKDQYQLEKISEGLDLSVDYGFLWMIAQPLYALLFFFNTGTLHAFGYKLDIFGGVGNWGFSIILLTILVKACFYSLNVKAYTSMAKMRAIQPKMLALKERLGDDRQKMSQETMALYKNEGVNPLGGCLPMLVQMPVFISLYWVLLESVELRHAPFIGYIKDLSAMDPYFIMPLIMGASMFIQQKLNPPPPDPMQAKIMQFLPVIFTFFFLFFPSGLVLYWVVNNCLTIAQQWFITRRIEAAANS